MSDQAVISEFFEGPERDACEKFTQTGLYIFDVEDRAALDSIQRKLSEGAAQFLGVSDPLPPSEFLNNIHRWVDVDDLNELRLFLINDLNGEEWLRSSYYALGRTALETLVGNELAMQRRVNLSIQLPGDDSSLLPLHADVWSGNSPFEVVLWTPLVDCYGTKAMFFLPPEPNTAAEIRMHEFRDVSAEELYSTVEPDLEWVDIAYGQAMVFTQNQMHGNRVNREAETRWSINCRFKSLFSPYAGKRLGEFFEPITIRPATRLGMNYQLPQGFDE
tara:strand:- start:1386 stop:2210 length:825 start_codon:yes stop_codon:yes gene_type:complete